MPRPDRPKPWWRPRLGDERGDVPHPGCSDRVGDAVRVHVGVRNTVTGRWVAERVATDAVKATAETAAHTAADAALTSANINQPAGTSEFPALPALNTL